MRIKSETADMLVLEDRPLLVALLLSAFLLIDAAAVVGLALQGDWAGVGMLGLGIPFLLVGFFFFVRRTLVFFDRIGGQVTIRVATLRGQKEEQLPLADVAGAEVQVNRSSKGGNTSVPILVLRGGAKKPLLSVSTSGRGPGRAVHAINRWLGGEGPRG